MSSKKEIKTVTNSRENVLNVKKVTGDPTRIELTGQDAGITHLELTDVDGKTETFEVIVQADVEFLRIQLKRLVPHGEHRRRSPISNNFIVPARDGQPHLGRGPRSRPGRDRFPRHARSSTS